MDNSLAPGDADPLADVALAWKSLRKAEAVLQRIENKFYHQTWSCAKSQAARRKLWCEKSFDGERNRAETPLNEKKSNEIAPACREGNVAALCPAWSQTCFLESPPVSSGPSRRTPLSSRGDSGSAPCSPARREAVGGEGPVGMWSPAKSLHRPRKDDSREQADSRGHTGQEGKSPCSLHHPPHSLFSAVSRGNQSNAPVPTDLLPTYHLPSTNKPSHQKLEELWKKSPHNKLELLKKRIQEQKQKQQEASREQQHLSSACAKEALQKRSLKRKVCRVSSAPPALVHRDQRERSSARRIPTQSQRQLSPKSSVLERAMTGKGAKLPGASAWREGQKLARKLLGPPPPFPNLRSTAEEQNTADILECGRGFVAKPVMEKSTREKGNESVEEHPEFQSCVVPSSKPAERSCNAPTKDTKQILRNLYLQSQEGDDHRHTRLPKDPVKGKVEVLQPYPGIHPPSPRPQAITPSAFRWGKIQFSLVKDGAKPSSSGNCSRGKSTSPQRQKGSSSPAQKGSEKENLHHPSKRRVNMKKPHPYSPETVQEFMHRKNEERKKKSLQEKKSLVQATEMRNKRLQEVYRKQKEAVGKQKCSEQVHKLVGEAASARGIPQCKPEQEQTSGGILGRSFTAWVDKTSCTLLNKDHRGRNQVLGTVQSPEKREGLASPASLESECWSLRPLECEDLRDCSPAALHPPPPSSSPPQKDAKPSSKDSTSGSPCRSKQDGVKAIHSLSKELGEKIEMAAKRLNAASWAKDSADKTLAEAAWDLVNEPCSAPEPETTQAEQDGPLTIQMLLDAPGPDELCDLSDRFHGMGRRSLMGGTKGETTLGRQQEAPTALPGGSAGVKGLPWITPSTGQRHLRAGGGLSNTLQGFPGNKGYEVDRSLLHDKPITSPASPALRFLTGSLQRALPAQRDHYWCETILKVQNQEEVATQSPGESLRTRDSLSLQPSAYNGSEQNFGSAGEGEPTYTAPGEKHRSHLDNLRQTSLLLAHRLKVHQLQQKQQLTVLREKAKLEVEESQRFLSDLLQPSSEVSSSSKGSHPSVPGLDHTELARSRYQLEGDNTASSKQEMHSLKQSTLEMKRDHSPVDPKVVEERKPLGGRDSYCPVLQEVNLPHEEMSAGDDSGESSERASSGSQWSDVGQHYGGSSTFCSFSLAMAEQCLRGEELRARHQAALLKLRKRALQERARAELAWLGHQKRCLENLQDSKGASAIATKQHKILRELKQEQAEIQHLQNLYRAAHQERKLLLKQQREILMMQHSTAQLQEELHGLAGKQELTRNPATERPLKMKTMRPFFSPKLYSPSAESTAHPNLSGNRESCVQLKNKHSKTYEGFSTEKKKTLVRHQKQAEECTGLEQSLGARGPDAATGQTTGLVFRIKDCENTGLNAQDHVLLPLEHANSARMEEPISMPIAREGRKCAFLESVLEEKTLISNPKADPKDNGVINPCDSKFPVKDLGVLSPLCNSCLRQAENTLEGTVKELEVPVPCEMHQVDGSRCLKHLDDIPLEASEEELNLKAFSKGLNSTESKSNDFSLRCESATLGSSLPEFQKASAVWIDISKSSISDSELELKNGEDTDVSIPEEFVYDNSDVFPNLSRETLIAIRNGKKTFSSDKHNEHQVPKDDGTEISSCSQKYPGDVSHHSYTDDLLSYSPSGGANASKTNSADSSQSDKPAKGMEEPHPDATENYRKNKTWSQETTKQGKDAVASSSCSDDTDSPKIFEQQKPDSTAKRVKKDSGINSLFVPHNRNLMEFPLTGSLKHLDLITDPLRNNASFPSEKETTNNKLLAWLSSRNLSASGCKNSHAQLLNERLTSSELNTSTTAMPGISEEGHTESSSCESLQRKATGNQNNSTTERQAIKEARRGLHSSVSLEKQLLQAENCSSKAEEDAIFISDEGLPPTDEDTLSEILSPVDEVLSYGSADLPSSSKKDLSFLSEDLPAPPLGADAMKNDDSTFSVDDFPPPPEQMTVSETRQCMDEDVSLKMDALPPLPDNTVPEEFSLLYQETTGAFSPRDGILSEKSLVKEISSAKGGLVEHHQGEGGTTLQHLELLPVSSPVSSGQISESPDLQMKPCKTYLALPKDEEDSDDPLLSFEIGDRVLVKQSQPGTLMFKGRTCFDSGHWAGVALDKAEGDNAGTYKGVKYFECAQHCGIFVRPEEISHLLGADKNGSNSTGHEDSDCGDDDDKSFKGDCRYSEEDKKEGGLTQQKAEEANGEGGSEVKENQSRLHMALLSGKGPKLPHHNQSMYNEFLCQNNLMCLGSDKEKLELIQIKQRILADVLPVKSKFGNMNEVNASKSICCLVEDQKRNKVADDIASELFKKMFDTLIAFSATAQLKYKSTFQKDMMSYSKGLRQEDNQKLFLLKENSAANLPEQSPNVFDGLLCDFDIHGCHTVAERIIRKFVGDAVKEYKKIKRKHGSKADKIFHTSSEISPTTLPLLRKILDAGIFGSSEDFDQPYSDQYMPARQTQKLYLYKSDQWHSAPWKKTVEVPLVIPHCTSYVKKFSASAVEELWTAENIYSNFRRISVPKNFEFNDLPGNDLETESKRMYNQVIFDLTHELLCAEHQGSANPDTLPWMKENFGSWCSGHLCRRSVSDVKVFVQGEIIKIMNLEKNDLEIKRKILNMTKYGNFKRGRVDLILIQELCKEESQWIYYDDDELTVKMRMTEDIFESLILDTIRVLNMIYLRKARD